MLSHSDDSSNSKDASDPSSVDSVDSVEDLFQDLSFMAVSSCSHQDSLDERRYQSDETSYPSDVMSNQSDVISNQSEERSYPSEERSYQSDVKRNQVVNRVPNRTVDARVKRSLFRNSKMNHVTEYY